MSTSPSLDALDEWANRDRKPKPLPLDPPTREDVRTYWRYLRQARGLRDRQIEERHLLMCAVLCEASYEPTVSNEELGARLEQAKGRIGDLINRADDLNLIQRYRIRDKAMRREIELTDQGKRETGTFLKRLYKAMKRKGLKS